MLYILKSLKYFVITSFSQFEDVVCLGLIITSLIMGGEVLQRGHQHISQVYQYALLMMKEES